MTIAVAIYVFADVEVLDFAGPFEVFTTASRLLVPGGVVDHELTYAATARQLDVPYRGDA